MVTELLTATLKGLKKPVSRLFYKGKADTYFTFQSVLQQPDGYADDLSTITLHTLRVDLYSKKDYTELLGQTKAALLAAGFTISSVDAELYENDTGFYHVPITLKYMEV